MVMLINPFKLILAFSCYISEYKRERKNMKNTLEQKKDIILMKNHGSCTLMLTWSLKEMH